MRTGPWPSPHQCAHLFSWRVVCSAIGGRSPANPTCFCSTRPSDRKSTRLNSSHVAISYAVFCLKKKNKKDSQVLSSSHPLSVPLLLPLSPLPPHPRSPLFPYTTLFRSK